MRIGLAQIASQKNDLQYNIHRHVQVIEHAVNQRIDLLVFPELSLTGYDPESAASMAVEPTDSRLAVFDKLSKTTGMILGLGAPLLTPGKPSIGMLLFSGSGKRQVIGKQYLHEDEIPFFSTEVTENCLVADGIKIGFAICYEISIPEHFQKAMDNGCDLYLASVAKTDAGMQEALKILTTAAKQHRTPVLIVNCCGESEGKPAGGGSAIINSSGEVIAKLSSHADELLIFDSESGQALSIMEI